MKSMLTLLSLLATSVTCFAGSQTASKKHSEYISRWYQSSAYAELSQALEDQEIGPWAGRIISISSNDGENFKIVMWVDGSAEGTQCYSKAARVGYAIDDKGYPTRKGQVKLSAGITRLDASLCGMDKQLEN
jgi:hypothetical protein